MASLDAAHWPQWRGPVHTGEAPGAHPPTQWSEDENVQWKVRIPGSGSATPIIWENQIFVQTAISTGKRVEQPKETDNSAENEGNRRRRRSEAPNEVYQFVLLSIDRETGRTQWQRVAREELPHEGHHRDHGYSSYSPVTDGKRVYAYFGSRGLYCYDLDGNLKWEKDLGRMQTKMGFGEGSSPALYGDTLVINWDHEGEDFIVALDKMTGEERWRRQREEMTSWATPLVLEHGGSAQVITAATGKVRGYDLESGKTIWEYDGLTANVIPTPVAGEGLVYVMSGFRGNKLYAIRLGFTGELNASEAIAWTYSRSTPYVPSPVLYKGNLYFLSGNSGLLSCLDSQTGKVLYDAVRIEGLQGVYASPVAANGRIYVVGRNGATAVINAGDQFELVALNQLDEKIDASPAIVDDDLFLRGSEHLYRISNNPKSGSSL